VTVKEVNHIRCFEIIRRHLSKDKEYNGLKKYGQKDIQWWTKTLQRKLKINDHMHEPQKNQTTTARGAKRQGNGRYM
jgi:hypothetical protein